MHGDLGGILDGLGDASDYYDGHCGQWVTEGVAETYVVFAP